MSKLIFIGIVFVSLLFRTNNGANRMRTLGFTVLVLSFLFPAGSYAGGTLKCGIKPIPNIGCRIGRCVDGQWEQVCDSTPTLSCGIKPLPDIGCKIGRCVDGKWEQVCD